MGNGKFGRRAVSILNRYISLTGISIDDLKYIVLKNAAAINILTDEDALAFSNSNEVVNGLISCTLARKMERNKKYDSIELTDRDKILINKYKEEKYPFKIKEEAFENIRKDITPIKKDSNNVQRNIVSTKKINISGNVVIYSDLNKLYYNEIATTKEEENFSVDNLKTYI